MTKNTQLARTQPTEKLLRFNEDDMKMLAQVVFKDAQSVAEVRLLIAACEYIGLNPMNGEVFPIKSKGGGIKLQPGIPGYRKLAERSGLYEGPAPMFFREKIDGPWIPDEDWDSTKIPWACKAGVYRKGWRDPVYFVAKYADFVQRKDGKPFGRWYTHPSYQLSIRAEAQAIQRAFPNWRPELPSKVEVDGEQVSVRDSVDFAGHSEEDDGGDEKPKLAQLVWEDAGCQEIIEKLGMMPDQLDLFLAKGKAKNINDAYMLLDRELQGRQPSKSKIIDAEFTEAGGHQDLDDENPAGDKSALFGDGE